MVLSLMFLSLPIPIPFDWQLPEVKKLNFVDQYFSPYVLPRLGVLWSLTPKAPGGEQEGQARLPRGRRRKAGMSLRPHRGFHHRAGLFSGVFLSASA